MVWDHLTPILLQLLYRIVQKEVNQDCIDMGLCGFGVGILVFFLRSRFGFFFCTAPV